MATVNLNLSFDSNQINISLLSKEMIEFNKKWSKIVELFKGELFVEDGEGNLWLLTSSDEELLIQWVIVILDLESPHSRRSFTRIYLSCRKLIMVREDILFVQR